MQIWIDPSSNVPTSRVVVWVASDLSPQPGLANQRALEFVSIPNSASCRAWGKSAFTTQGTGTSFLLITCNNVTLSLFLLLQ